MAQNFRRKQFLRTTIVEAYTKRRLPHNLVIRHPQVVCRIYALLKRIILHRSPLAGCFRSCGRQPTATQGGGR